MNNANDAIMAALATGMQGIATRPQKVGQLTTTKPIESDYMRQLRDALGADRVNLNNQMEKRESLPYGIAEALSNIQTPQSNNPWATGLGNFATAFGGAMKAKTDRGIERAQSQYDTTMKDTAAALDISKAMGQQQTDQMTYAGGDNTTDAAYAQHIMLNPERMQELRDLNLRAGRFNTNAYDPSSKSQGFTSRMGITLMPGVDYGIASSKGTDAAKAYQEWSGKAISQFQRDLKQIYGSQLSDSESERFFATLGINPVTDPETRQRLFDNAVEQWAVKNGLNPTYAKPINKTSEMDALLGGF